MDGFSFRDWVLVGNTFAVGLTAFFSWFMARSKANSDAIKELDIEIATLKQETAAIKSDADKTSQMLARIGDDINAVHQRVDEVAQSTARQDGKLEAIAHALSLIQAAMLEERK